MSGFISYALQIRSFVHQIVDTPELHAKWLNTLSFLENCGARKIAACEHPTLVKEEILKHASEEFRHAHFLKKQIARVWPDPIETYSTHNLLGGITTLHYLHSLDVQTSRYLKEIGFSATTFKEAAYTLVTYAIERRASELYPIYQDILRTKNVHVSVSSILLEEKEHLAEMERELVRLPSGLELALHLCALESGLCKKWLEALNVSLYALQPC